MRSDDASDDYWMIVDRMLQSSPRYIRPNGKCVYHMEYWPHQGYQASEANRKIINLKKPVDRKGKSEWYYKGKAIEQFAVDLAYLISDYDNVALVPIPPSQARTDPLYDDRIDQVCNRATDFVRTLFRYMGNARVCPLLEQAVTVPSSHLGTERRDPDQIKAGLTISYDHNLDWVQTLILVDDVLTSGAHFTACRELIEETYPLLAGRIRGAFWARSVNPVA